MDSQRLNALNLSALVVTSDIPNNEAVILSIQAKTKFVALRIEIRPLSERGQ